MDAFIGFVLGIAALAVNLGVHGALNEKEDAIVASAVAQDKAMADIAAAAGMGPGQTGKSGTK